MHGRWTKFLGWMDALGVLLVLVWAHLFLALLGRAVDGVGGGRGADALEGSALLELGRRATVSGAGAWTRRFRPQGLFGAGLPARLAGFAHAAVPPIRRKSGSESFSG